MNGCHRSGRSLRARAAAAASTEAAFQASVVSLAKLMGWRVYHTYDSRRSTAGFPDLVLVRRRDQRVLYRELKRNGEKLKPAQVEWIEDLVSCGQDAQGWWPSDWDEIVETLR